jgi:hypothetical protein
LVERAYGFKPTQKYQDALDLYIKSLSSERASYTAFRDFVETGDPKLNESSIDLLSNATKYELESFALIAAEKDTTSGADTSADPNSVLTPFTSCFMSQ